MKANKEAMNKIGALIESEAKRIVKLLMKDNLSVLPAVASTGCAFAIVCRLFGIHEETAVEVFKEIWKDAPRALKAQQDEKK